MDFHFPVVHLKTWLTRWDELENIAASNPFALLIMAQLQAQKTAKKGEQRGRDTATPAYPQIRALALASAATHTVSDVKAAGSLVVEYPGRTKHG